MKYTIEDIKKAFRAGKDSTDKYAKLKTFALDCNEYAERLASDGDLANVSKCDLCNGTGYISVDNEVVPCHSF